VDPLTEVLDFSLANLSCICTLIFEVFLSIENVNSEYLEEIKTIQIRKIYVYINIFMQIFIVIGIPDT